MSLAFCLTGMVLSADLSAQSRRYAVIELGNLGGGTALSFGINEAGDVVGSTHIPSRDYHPMAWRDGVMIDLNPDLLGNGRAQEINDLGQIVGFAEFEGFFLKERAFLWEDGEMFDLGTLGGENSEARAINNRGQIVGDSHIELVSARWHPFLWENGVMRPLLPPPCDSCSGTAHDINNLGQIVGGVSTPQIPGHPVLWDDGEIIDLGSLGDGGTNTAQGINELGQIVGISRGHAFFWEDGVMIDLDPGFASSSAIAINNNSIIVGIDFKGRNKGTLWDANRKKHNLNCEIAPLPTWWIDSAFDINDNNQIAAQGVLAKGKPAEFHAFLLTPVTPTFKLSEPSPGIAGQVNTITARGGSLVPGTEVHFFWGAHGGGTLVPTCDMLDAVLQMENAKSAGSAIVDANGVATLKGKIPAGAAGTYILLQAIVGPDAPGGCTQSQLVVVRFE